MPRLMRRFTMSNAESTATEVIRRAAGLTRFPRSPNLTEAANAFVVTNFGFDTLSSGHGWTQCILTGTTISNRIAVSLNKPRICSHSKADGGHTVFKVRFVRSL